MTRRDGEIWKWRENSQTMIENYFKNHRLDEPIDPFLAKLWKTFPCSSLVPSAGQQVLNVYLPNSPIVMEYWFRPVHCNWRNIILSYAILPRRIIQEWSHLDQFFHTPQYINQTLVSAMIGNPTALNILAIWTKCYTLPKTKEQIIEISKKYQGEPHQIICGMYITLQDKSLETIRTMVEYWNHPFVRYFYYCLTDQKYFNDLREVYSPICMLTNWGHLQISTYKHPYACLFGNANNNAQQNKNAIADELELNGSTILAQIYRNKANKNNLSKKALRKLDQNLAQFLKFGLTKPQSINAKLTLENCFYMITGLIIVISAACMLIRNLYSS